ncbi:MAG: NADH-quinone oxidoreductase subunit L [Clostridiales Family XIII bacterium]|nr:NADH-quinone oxidoreductase subunit L [Clostridiales Family XIII bacterium]
METIIVLILIPLVIALALLFVRRDVARGPVVFIGAAATAALSVVLAIQQGIWSGATANMLWAGATESSEIAGYVMMGIEAALAVAIFILGVKYKKALACILVAVQCPLLIWFELTKGHEIEVKNNIGIDQFSLIMVLIIGIIGTLICVYAVAYMKDFQHHLEGGPDRRWWFFFLLFIFLSAMFGIVLSNNLIYMYFFWEITTLCSFFLIGYTKTDEAVRNSFRALIMNLLGGLAFVLAIVLLGTTMDTLEIDRLIQMGVETKAQLQAGMLQDPSQYYVINAVVMLLCFAGITKAAQMPFNSWLLGAMVAPTPTSALLHSSTMVKAGVFLIVKLSPLLGVQGILSINEPGFMVMMVGGITFLLASFAAVTQSNAKRVLAYSTIANLGLIVACAGIGTAEGVWAATMLIIFHAVTKSLLFLSVGTAEHNIGSRDIEDMDGLFGRLPRLAVFMIIGIAGMFLAPFGMLVSKWAALQSFVDAGGIWVVLMIVFGSAVTLFYWGKWLGKLTAIVANRQNIQDKVHGEEWFVLTGHIVLVILISLSFPLFSGNVIVPFIKNVFAGMSDAAATALSSSEMVIMVVLVCVILVLPLLFYGRTRKRIVPLYMGGANEGDNLTFRGAMEKDVPVSLRNWYMEGVFGEKLMNRIGLISTCIIFALSFSFVAFIALNMFRYFQEGGAV